MMPTHCKEVSPRTVDFSLTAGNIRRELMGKSIYRLTRYLVLEMAPKSEMEHGVCGDTWDNGPHEKHANHGNEDVHEKHANHGNEDVHEKHANHENEDVHGAIGDQGKDTEHAVVEISVGQGDRRSLFRPITAVRVISLPCNTFYLELPGQDVLDEDGVREAVMTALPRPFKGRPGRRFVVVVKGKFEHLSFIVLTSAFC